MNMSKSTLTKDGVHIAPQCTHEPNSLPHSVFTEGVSVVGRRNADIADTDYVTLMLVGRGLRAADRNRGA